jgi:hypothetical protein
MLSLSSLAQAINFSRNSALIFTEHCQASIGRNVLQERYLQSIKNISKMSSMFLRASPDFSFSAFWSHLTVLILKTRFSPLNQTPSQNTSTRRGGLIIATTHRSWKAASELAKVPRCVY